MRRRHMRCLGRTAQSTTTQFLTLIYDLSARVSCDNHEYSLYGARTGITEGYQTEPAVKGFCPSLPVTLPAILHERYLHHVFCILLPSRCCCDGYYSVSCKLYHSELISVYRDIVGSSFGTPGIGNLNLPAETTARVRLLTEKEAIFAKM